MPGISKKMQPIYQKMPQILALTSPLFVKWYITSKCNLRCTHCYLTDYTVTPPLEKILPIVDHLANSGVKRISLLGGEPLVRDDLEIIVERIGSKGMLPYIATNGTLVNPARARSLVSAGAKHFQVSLEGSGHLLNDEVRGEGAYEAALNGVRSLVQEGASVTLAVTLTKHNQTALEKLFQLAQLLGVKVLRFNAFMPVGTGAALSAGLLQPQEIDSIRRKVASLVPKTSGSARSFLE